MAAIDNFHIVDRLHGSCWLHNSKPMWIVHYPLAPRNPHYQAYRPADWIGADDLRNRYPWTLDNRKLSMRGFKTLEEAAQAIENWKTMPAYE